MGANELNDGLRQHLVKPGDPGRNPLGHNGRDTRIANRQLARMLINEGDLPCPYPGFEHLTKAQYVAKEIYDQAMAGDKRAIKMIWERVFGRVPYTVDVTRESITDVTVHLETLSDEQLADYMIQAAISRKAEIADERRRRAIEAVPVEPTETDLGSAPVGVSPKGPVND